MAEETSGTGTATSTGGSNGGASGSAATTAGSTANSTGGDKASIQGSATASAAPASAQTQGGEQDGGAPKVYTPNFKYQANKEDKEIPEWARGFLTNEEIEKNMRRLFERSDGFDPLNQTNNIIKTENQQMREQWLPVVQQTQKAMGHLQRGDMHSFLDSVGVTETQVLQHALKILQMKENPQAAESFNRERVHQQQIAALTEQVNALQQGYSQTSVQSREMELAQAIASSNVAQASQAFDRATKPGGFREKCVMIGQMYAARGIDAPVDKVVAEALQLIGWNGQTTTPQVVPPVSSQGAQTPEESKQLLPNLKGRGTSPTKKVFKSTDELRAHARGLG